MPLLVQRADDADRERFERFEMLIRRLARLETIDLVGDDRDSSDCAVQLCGRMRLLIPLAGLVDVDEELARLDKQLERETRGRRQAENKLANERFVANAPADVVARERQRLAEHTEKVADLEAQIEKLRAMG
jgi:valyl-tRNA synthetase